MSKIIESTCSNKVVMANGSVVPDCKIASEGIGPSEGWLLISEDQFFYIGNTIKNVKDVIDAIDELFDKLSLFIPEVHDVTGSPKPSLVAPATFLADIAALKVKLATTKAALC